MIVISYSGREIPEYIQQKMVEQLIINGLCDQATLKFIQYDDQAIADAVVATASASPKIPMALQVKNENELVQNAAAYIHGKYLSGKTEISASSLCARMCIDAQLGDEKLKTAIKTIAEASSVPAYVRINHNLGQEVQNIIREAYNVLRQ